MQKSSKVSAKTSTFKDISAMFPKKKPTQPVSIEAMKRVVVQGAVRRFKTAVG